MPRRNPDVEPEPITPHSSINEIKAFAESIIWQDALRYIRANIENVTRQLKQSSDLMDIKKYQGLLECAEDMENLPDILIEIKQNADKDDDDTE